MRQKPGLTPRLHNAFEAFWKAYPARRPNPKVLAREAFLAVAAELTDPEMLARAAQRFAEECRREKIEPGFVPHARTWLKQRRFEDYPDPPEADAPAQPAQADPRGPLCAALLAQGMTLPEYTAWIEPLVITLVGQDSGQVAVAAAPSRLIADRVREQHAAQLARALGVPRVRVEVRR